MSEDQPVGYILLIAIPILMGIVVVVLEIRKGCRIRRARGEQIGSLVCTYGGGTRIAGPQWCRLVVAIVYRRVVVVRSLPWDKPIEFVKENLHNVTRLQSPEDIRSATTHLCEDFDDAAAKATEKGASWNYILARWGGEEAVLIFDTSEDAAQFLRITDASWVEHG